MILPIVTIMALHLGPTDDCIGCDDCEGRDERGTTQLGVRFWFRLPFFASLTARYITRSPEGASLPPYLRQVGLT